MNARNVQSSIAMMRNGEVNVDGILIDLVTIHQRLRRGGRIGIRRFKKQPVRKYARRARERDRSRSERGLIDLQPLKSPGPKIQRLHLELKRVLDEPVLALEMLRSKKRPLRPDHRLQSLHILSTIQRAGFRDARKPDLTACIANRENFGI